MHTENPDLSIVAHNSAGITSSADDILRIWKRTRVTVTADSRGGQNIPELPGRSPKELQGMDLPPAYTMLFG